MTHHLCEFSDVTATTTVTRAVQPMATSPIVLSQPAIVIVTSFSLWRASCLRHSQLPFSLWRHSHCDFICYWAGHAHRYGHTNVRTDTLPCL